MTTNSTTEPCSIKKMSFIDWIKWVEENRLKVTCIIIETSINHKAGRTVYNVIK